MKNTIAVFCLFCAVMPGLAKWKDIDEIRWFDSSGAFHLGSPEKYCDLVRNGNLEDPVIKSMIEAGFPENPIWDTQTHEQFKLRFESAEGEGYVLLPDKKSIKKESKAFKKAFNERAAKTERGEILLQGFAVQNQAPKQMNIDIHEIVVAVPADPALIAEITQDRNEKGIPIVESLITNAALSRSWASYANRTQIDAGGRGLLQNLVPGPWLIWVNQHGVLTYLYRIEVQSGKSITVNLGSVFSFIPIHLNQAASDQK